MTRLDATRRLLAALERDPGAAIVASLGHPAYDLFAAGDRSANFYTWGSMGLATSIALGIALAQPSRQVVALDGDGSLLMNLGSLATIGALRPPNLLVIVWDNEQYGTTGGQTSPTAATADLASAARAMGIADSCVVRDVDAFDTAIARTGRVPGPAVIVAKVSENTPAVKPPLDAVFIKQRFMAAIGVAEAATQGGAA
jgi:thiamine pyrophosphate-dependent acetolactate synthase large subunit-like protein